MFCTQCGNKVDEKTHICLNCGCYVTDLVDYKNLVPTKKIELKVRSVSELSMNDSGTDQLFTVVPRSKLSGRHTTLRHIKNDIPSL